VSGRLVRPVPPTFFEGGTRTVARRLIGARLVHEHPDGTTVGRIVETEAYLSKGDPASHSHPGPTARNASMFLPPGHAYVYLIYGLHHCFNVVTAPEGVGEAVLVRALEPLEGLDLMRERRGGAPVARLCRGPGNLARALGIGPASDGADLRAGALYLAPHEPGWRAGPIERGPRVGITKAAERPLRFRQRACPWCTR
jgi:DNA-3-methyladenine glycosylase